MASRNHATRKRRQSQVLRARYRADQGRRIRAGGTAPGGPVIMARSVCVSLLAGALCATPPASAQSNDASLRLVVEEGTPLRVALDRRWSSGA